MACKKCTIKFDIGTRIKTISTVIEANYYSKEDSTSDAMLLNFMNTVTTISLESIVFIVVKDDVSKMTSSIPINKIVDIELSIEE